MMPPSIPLPQLLLLFVVAIVIYGVSQLRPK
jgi:Sec-independent protein translocase protein TatA